jgi:L-threonylcarbamoyladenylate synthase
MADSRSTRVLAVDPQRPEPETIGVAAELLRAGGLVAFPTETVYGLGANARDEAAVTRIFAAKGRPATDPLIVHVAAPGDVAAVAREIPDRVAELAARFWPGPLTLVLRRGPDIPASVSAGLDTVAVRVPAHPVALALIRAAGVPVAAPSANRFARPSPTTARHVLDDLAGRVELVLDGGPTAIGIESTVLDLSGPTPAVLRPGGVALEALRELLPGVAFVPRFYDLATAASAPGGLLKHYSPEAELWLIRGPAPAVLRQIQISADQLHRKGRRVGVLAADEDLAALAGIPALVRSLGSEQDLGGIGRHLFGHIRAIDAADVDIILVRGFQREGLGLAIWDRLVRAAEGRVVEVG